MRLRHARLLEKLRYDPDTGYFYHRDTGKRAGNQQLDGYRRVGVDGKNYPEGRLAWFYMEGEWPTGVIDHINHDPSDNSWANLRDCSRSENHRFRRKFKNNTSGYKGVWEKRGRWIASLTYERRRYHLGTFDTREEAARAYDDKALELFGEFAKTNFPVPEPSDPVAAPAGRAGRAEGSRGVRPADGDADREDQGHPG